MRKILGQYALSFDDNVEIEGTTASYSSLTTKAQEEFEKVKNIMVESYGKESLEISDNKVWYSYGFAESGFGFEINNYGFTFIVNFPIFRKDKVDLGNLRLLLIPKRENVDNADCLWYLGKINYAITVFLNLSIYYTCPYKMFYLDSLDFYSEGYRNLYSYDSMSSYPIEFDFGCRNNTVYTPYFVDVNFIPSDFKFRLKRDVAFSISFLEEGCRFSVSLNSNFSFSFTITDKTIFSYNAKKPEDASLIWGFCDNREEKMKFDFNLKATYSQERFLNKIISYTDSFVLKGINLSSSIMPLYSVSDCPLDIEDLKMRIGSNIFACNEKTKEYCSRTIVDVQEDDNGNILIRLDDYIPYSLDNVALVMGIFDLIQFVITNEYNSDSDMRYSKTYYSSNKACGTNYFYFPKWPVDSIRHNFSSSLDLFSFFEKSVIGDKTLKERFGYFIDDFKLDFKKMPKVLYSLPFIPIDMEEFEKLNYEMSYLPFEKIPEMGNVATVKPLLVVTKHPSGRGYAILGRIPNFVAVDIKSIFNYIPYKIFINEEDKGKSYSAFVATKAYQDGAYTVYFLINKVSSVKPFIAFPKEL